jgi:hypothetical protein
VKRHHSVSLKEKKDAELKALANSLRIENVLGEDCLFISNFE